MSWNLDSSSGTIQRGKLNNQYLNDRGMSYTKNGTAGRNDQIIDGSILTGSRRRSMSHQAFSGTKEGRDVNLVVLNNACDLMSRDAHCS